MNTFYNNYNFQKLHSKKENILTSPYKNLNHSCKVIKSKIKGINYAETGWGYSYPYECQNQSLSLTWKKWSEYCKDLNIIAEIIKIPPFINFSSIDQSILTEQHIVSKTCALYLNESDYLKEFNKKTRYLIRKSENLLSIRKASMSDSKSISDLYDESMTKLNASDRFFLKKDTFDFLIDNRDSSIKLAFIDDSLIGFVCFLFDKAFLFLVSVLENLCHYLP